MNSSVSIRLRRFVLRDEQLKAERSRNRPILSETHLSTVNLTSRRTTGRGERGNETDQSSESDANPFRLASAANRGLRNRSEQKRFYELSRGNEDCFPPLRPSRVNFPELRVAHGETTNDPLTSRLPHSVWHRLVIDFSTAPVENVAQHLGRYLNGFESEVSEGAGSTMHGSSKAAGVLSVQFCSGQDCQVATLPLEFQPLKAIRYLNGQALQHERRTSARKPFAVNGISSPRTNFERFK